jgi:hypothetical protein
MALHKENVSAWGKEGDIDYRISANENYAYYANARGERNDDGSLAPDFYPYPGRYFEVGLTVDF